MSEVTNKLAVIYTRVSSDKQIQDGTGLETQEKICREKAEQDGYTILKVFSDAGISGKSMLNRPGILSLLQFLKTTKEQITVIAYDTDRLSRDTGDFITIRTIIHTNNHNLVTIKNGLIGQDSTSNLLSTVISAVGQCEREKNAERSKNNMRTIMSDGYWLLKEPIGLKKCMLKTSEKYRWLLRVEPEATIIQEALNKFASAELPNQADVVNFLIAEYQKYGLPQYSNWFDKVKQILREEKYTGYFEYKNWGIPHRKGFIEPLITVETFKLIQQRLKGKERIKHTTYNKNDERLPLRGQILCPFCHKPLTGSFTKGGTIPYYQCQTHGCSNKRYVNVRPEILHKDFEDLLEHIVPAEEIINTAKSISLDLYNQKMKDIESKNHMKVLRLQKIDKEIQDAFIGYDRSTNDTIKHMYEEKIENLTKEKQILTEETEDFKNDSQISFPEALKIVIDTISHPAKIWKDADLKTRRAMCDILFLEKPFYDKINKFQNIKLLPVFNQIVFIGSNRNTTIVDVFSYIVPDLEKFDKKSVLEAIKSGTVVFPQIFKDYHKKVMGNSYLVP